MTHMTQTHLTKRGAPVRQLFSDLNMSLAQRLSQYRAYRSTVRELQACSNRELADMGIYRADIHRIAQQAAYEAP